MTDNWTLEHAKAYLQDKRGFRIRGEAKKLYRIEEVEATLKAEGPWRWRDAGREIEFDCDEMTEIVRQICPEFHDHDLEYYIQRVNTIIVYGLIFVVLIDNSRKAVRLIRVFEAKKMIPKSTLNDIGLVGGVIFGKRGSPGDDRRIRLYDDCCLENLQRPAIDGGPHLFLEGGVLAANARDRGGEFQGTRRLQ